MADTAKQQFLNDLQKTVVNGEGLTQKEYEPFKETVYSLVMEEKFDETLDKLEEYENEHGWNLEEEKSFLQEIANPGSLETVDEPEVDKGYPKRQRLILERQLQESGEDGVIKKTEKSVGTEQLKKLHEHLYRETGLTSFVISAQKTYDGRVSVELSSTKEKFELMSVYKNSDGELFFKHFGENNPNKGYNKEEEFTKSFYQYKFEADDKEYLVLSLDRLDTVRCKLKGVKISLNDYKTVGEFSKVAVNQDIIFVHSAEPAVDTMTDKELESYRKGLTHDDLAESLLGGWRQPEWFEKLLISDIMVNDENGYPSHLIWLAEPGTGKSKVAESVLRSLDEKQKEPFTGSGSTVKGLVPSFKDSPPDEGYLLKTQRVAAVDEKMDLLSNSIKQGQGAANDVFRPLLNLLTHDTRTFESGNGSIKGQMMSTMIATGNFNAYGIKNMKELAEKIDTAYLSRCIIYSQTKSHVDFINKRKAKVKQRMQEENLQEEDLFPERDDDFISLVDTMREDKQPVIDYLRVGEIHDELMEVVPGYMREIFRQRGSHHIENILLGYVKYEWLTGGKDSLEACDEDYDMVKKLFELVISGWDNVDTEKLSFEAKKEALTPPQRRVFNLVDDNPGVTAEKISKEVTVDRLSWCLTSLKRTGLIASNDDEEGNPVYPFWSDEFDELSSSDRIY